jgi:DNA replication protein DnaC
MTDSSEFESEFVRIVPTDLWAGYEGTGQFPPEDPEDLARFDQALKLETTHRGVPPEYREAYEMPNAAIDWANHGNSLAQPGRPSSVRNLVLWGDVGTGKTHGAIAAGCLYAALHSKSFKFLQSYSWLRVAKNWDSKAALEEARADATVPGIVVLDDIGRTKATPTDVETLTEMLDHRRWHLKPTIFTTNQPPVMFEEYFGAHLASRILGSAEIIPVTGEDRR